MREGAGVRPCVRPSVRVSVCVYVRCAARQGGRVLLPAGSGGKGGKRAARQGSSPVLQGLAARVCHRWQGSEAEIAGVAERSCGGASEKRGRHRLLLRSAFFPIASGEAAGPAALTCNSHH